MLAKRFVSAKNKQGTLWFKKFREKLHIAETPIVRTIWTPLYFCMHKQFGLVRDSNPRTSASQSPSAGLEPGLTSRPSGS